MSTVYEECNSTLGAFTSISCDFIQDRNYLSDFFCVWLVQTLRSLNGAPAEPNS